LTNFKDYPEEEYDHKLPWYTWMKDQIRKKDAWKRRMEKELHDELETAQKHIERKDDLEAKEWWRGVKATLETFLGKEEAKNE